MSWRVGHPGGVIVCDVAGCASQRRSYCTPSEREGWRSFEGQIVWDLCPTHADHSGDAADVHIYLGPWDPIGGYVCSACGQPTESEPCADHQSGGTS